MDNESLHQQVDDLVGSWRSEQRMVIHALIDLGRVTAIECDYEKCSLDSRAFTPTGPGNGRWNHAGLTIDHIIALADGGTDRSENLRLMHWICNVSLGTSQGRNRPEARARSAEVMRARWEDQTYRDKMRASSGTEESREKRRDSMQQKWQEPGYRERMSESARAGWRESRDVSPTMCNCGQGPFKGVSGVKLHQKGKNCGTVCT